MTLPQLPRVSSDLGSAFLLENAAMPDKEPKPMVCLMIEPKEDRDYFHVYARPVLVTLCPNGHKKIRNASSAF